MSPKIAGLYKCVRSTAAAVIVGVTTEALIKRIWSSYVVCIHSSLPVISGSYLLRKCGHITEVAFLEGENGVEEMYLSQKEKPVRP